MGCNLLVLMSDKVVARLNWKARARLGVIQATKPPTKRKVTMTTKLWKQLLRKFCFHRFSWPHSGGHGQDYQICLICGTVYEYDWLTMRRTHPLPSAPEPNANWTQRAAR